MHQIMLISLFSTSFDHFHFHGFLKSKQMVILKCCLISYQLPTVVVIVDHVINIHPSKTANVLKLSIGSDDASLIGDSDGEKRIGCSQGKGLRAKECAFWADYLPHLLKKGESYKEISEHRFYQQGCDIWTRRLCKRKMFLQMGHLDI